MFRCVECGAKYENTPQYCDCGNDIFEEVRLETISSNIPSIKKTQKFVEIDDIEDTQKPFDILPVGIFIFCIIIAGILLFTVEKPKNETKTPAKTQTISQNIPAIDTFWDDTPPAAKETKPQTSNSNIIEIAEQPLPNEAKDPITDKFEKWLNSPKRVEQESSKTVSDNNFKINSQPQKNNIQKNITAKAVSKAQTAANTTSKINQPQQPDNVKKDLITRVQTNAQNTITAQSQTPKTNSQPVQIQPQPQPKQQPQNQAKLPVQTQSQPAQTQTPKSQQIQSKPQTQTQQPFQVQTKPELRNATHQPVKTQAEIIQEVNNYKASLRNTIGKKINFANVVGDGSCAVSFTVDSNGKLTNRKFSKQSSNITLNDAVYSAMMSTPTFKAPPEGYKGETMTINVKFYNGNFEISLN